MQPSSCVGAKNAQTKTRTVLRTRVLLAKIENEAETTFINTKNEE